MTLAKVFKILHQGLMLGSLALLFVFSPVQAARLAPSPSTPKKVLGVVVHMRVLAQGQHAQGDIVSAE